MIIEAQKLKVPVHFSCDYLGVNRASYYKSLRRGPVDNSLDLAIEAVFNESKGRYGSPRVHRELHRQGVQASENTVAKKMKSLALVARKKKKYKTSKAEIETKKVIAPRLVKTDEKLSVEDLNTITAGDITYLKLDNINFYLSVVLDLCNREVLGWSLDDNLKSQGVKTALSLAVKRNSKLLEGEVIFHSDRGSQYSSEQYQDLLRDYNITASMSRSGNCYDNAFVESWFKTFKAEFFYKDGIRSIESLKGQIDEYITWYNEKRLHSSLGYLSPVMYKEEKLAA